MNLKWLIGITPFEIADEHENMIESIDEHDKDAKSVCRNIIGPHVSAQSS